MVTVAMDAQGPARARPFVEKAGLTAPAAVDREGLLWSRFGFGVVPVQLYFNAEGRLVYLSRGRPEGEVLERLDAELAQATTPPPALAGPTAVTDTAVTDTPATAPEPDAVQALFSRGVRALDAGRKDEALALWREALAAAPDNWLIRKQVWTLEAPDRFWGEAIDFDWQAERLARDRAEQP